MKSKLSAKETIRRPRTSRKKSASDSEDVLEDVVVKIPITNYTYDDSVSNGIYYIELYIII